MKRKESPVFLRREGMGLSICGLQKDYFTVYPSIGGGVGMGVFIGDQGMLCLREDCRRCFIEFFFSLR